MKRQQHMPDHLPNNPSAQPLLTRWRRKFACALRGVVAGVWGQNSFCIHLPAVVVVVAVGAWLEVSHAEWLALVLCIVMVLAAELFNSAIEHLARAVTRDEHPEIRDALDIASGAVLVAAVGACAVGAMVLLHHCTGSNVTP